MRIVVGLVLIIIGLFIVINDARYRREKKARSAEMSRFDGGNGALIVFLIGMFVVIGGIMTISGGD
jgi:hypothetical protein